VTKSREKTKTKLEAKRKRKETRIRDPRLLKENKITQFSCTSVIGKLETGNSQNPQ
jgi:hypothetical protein